MCVCQSVGAWLWEIHKLQQVMKQGEASKSFISYTTLAATIQSAQGLEKFNHAKHMCKARWCTINWIHAWGKSEKNNVKKIHTQHLANKTRSHRTSQAAAYHPHMLRHSEEAFHTEKLNGTSSIWQKTLKNKCFTQICQYILQMYSICVDI